MPPHRGVVGDVEHVVGFVIGQVDLQQMQALVDGVDQADRLRQQVDGADAAASDGAERLRHFVLDVAGAELGLERHGVFGFVEPAHDSALAFVEPTTENDLHLKSFRERGA